ncbi:MAG TPA: hypothetical protein VJY62_05975, partial [Bacteroidia bacterium]|nr:hypothetical protein [Bacteroidia bacterium]
MKKNLLLIFFLSAAFAGTGQNLVPNGDFEQFGSCPTTLSQLNTTLFWLNPTNGASTPDYFNQCGTGNAGIPVNIFGYQPAHSGAGYGGIHPWTLSSSNYREYIEVMLTSNLIANQCYHFEMYVNRANTNQYTIDNISVYFSDTAILGITNSDPLPFIPQINNSAGFITDTLNWTLISGTLTASGGERFIIIGNFNNDANTDTMLMNSSAPYAASYFYIDDVCLTPCGTPCYTGIQEQNQNHAINIYPNPVKDELFVNGYPLVGKTEIIISDILGKEIYRNQFSSLLGRDQIPTSKFK